MVGCCWHHDHSSQCRDVHIDRNTTEKTVAIPHRCGHSHDSDEKAPDAVELKDVVHSNHGGLPSEPSPCGDEHDHGPGECGEVACEYMASGEVKLPSIAQNDVAWGLNLAAMVGVCAGSDCPARSSVWDVLPSRLSGTLGVRDVTQIALL